MLPDCVRARVMGGVFLNLNMLDGWPCAAEVADCNLSFLRCSKVKLGEQTRSFWLGYPKTQNENRDFVFALNLMMRQSSLSGLLVWKTFPFKHFLRWEVHKMAQLHRVSPQANIVIPSSFRQPLTLQPFEKPAGCNITHEYVMHRYYMSSLTVEKWLQASQRGALCRYVEIIPLCGSQKQFPRIPRNSFPEVDICCSRW